MTQLSPEALAGLVERLNRLTPAGRDFRTTEIHSAIHEAAAAILALEAQLLNARRAGMQLIETPRVETARATRAEAVLREITEERDELRCALEVHRTMRSEVGHAMAAGPDWYTKGESGLRGQVRMWLTFADEAYATLARSLAAPVEKENLHEG